MEYWLRPRIGIQMAWDNSAALCVVRWLPSLQAGYQSTKRRITWEKKLYSLRRRSRMSMRIQMNCVLNSQHLIPINIPSRSWDSPREVCLNYDSNEMFRRKILGTIQWFALVRWFTLMIVFISIWAQRVLSQLPRPLGYARVCMSEQLPIWAISILRTFGLASTYSDLCSSDQL